MVRSTHLCKKAHAESCVDCLPSTTLSADNNALRFAILEELLISECCDGKYVWLLNFKSDRPLSCFRLILFYDHLRKEIGYIFERVHNEESLSNKGEDLIMLVAHLCAIEKFCLIEIGHIHQIIHAAKITSSFTTPYKDEHHRDFSRCACILNVLYFNVLEGVILSLNYRRTVFRYFLLRCIIIAHPAHLSYFHYYTRS